MNALLILVAGLALAAALYWLLRGPVRVWRFYRAGRVIDCPENHEPAAVSVNAWKAVTSGAGGHPELRLAECSRWPEKAGCGQECLAQIQAAPADCMVRAMVHRWYEGKSCALCGRAIESDAWHFELPAAIGPDNAPRQWSSFRAEELPRVFVTHRPVCGNCYLTEGFRAQHPDLVTDRPAR